MSPRAKNGQSIVIVALVLTVLLAFAGLAIDGGNAFLQRRQAQNAADAGSLAGTRVLSELIVVCDNEEGIDDGDVAAAVTNVIETNGFSVAEGSTLTAYYVDKDSTRQGVVGAQDGGNIPAKATGVEVELGAAFPTHFMKVVGIKKGSVAVDATAMTGRIIQYSGRGLLPVGVPYVEVYGHDDDVPALTWTVDDTRTYFCSGVDGDCTDDDDPNAQRAWLNFNYLYNAGEGYFEADAPRNRACNTSPTDNAKCDGNPPGLRAFVNPDCPKPAIYAGEPPDEPCTSDPSYPGCYHMDGDFVHGVVGAMPNGVSDIDKYFDPGDKLVAPIFDVIYSQDDIQADTWPLPDPNEPDEPDYCNTQAQPWPTGESSYLYHVVGFVEFELKSFLTAGGSGTEKGFIGELVGNTWGPGYIEPSDGLGSSCNLPVMFGVNLWE
jgi:hypothetical protein